jgi:putative DNA primase/helicase
MEANNSMTVSQNEVKQDLDYITTDSGNADRLIREYGREFAYCEPLGGWLHWKGMRWQVDNSAIWERARSIGKAWQHEAAEAHDRSDADRLWQHGRYTLSEPGLRRMIALAEKDSRVRVSPETFDSGPYLLNVENGTIDVRTGELHDHGRADLITKLAPVSYNPDATATRWQTFIERVLPTEDIRRYVQKAVGQALTGKVEQQAFYVNHGFGENGKSTFFDTIISMMGEYAGTIDIDVLMARKQNGNATPELASLKGKRFVVTSENEQGQRLKEGLVKRLTGDKTITARELYKGVITFERTFKLFMHVNHRPEITGTDHAMWRRLRLIPWEVRITKEEKDLHLLDKLEQELSGILNWALEGYRLYLEEGLEPPEAVREATAQYRDDMDKVTQFIKDECVTGAESFWVTKDRLYNVYKAWCGENGVYPESKRRFGEKLVEKEYDPNQRQMVAGKQVRVWRGIGLLSEHLSDTVDTADAQSESFSNEAFTGRLSIPVSTTSTTSTEGDGEYCIHGLRKDCYLHNPEHPYRKQQGW